MKKQFRYQAVFPYEAFVQRSIELFFAHNGYQLIQDAQVDLIAEKPGEKWFIEAKGESASPGLDFNTALGQLLKWMASPEPIYALALPKCSKYKRQCSLLPQYVRQRLGLRILVVDQGGGVSIIAPEQDPAEFF